MEKAFTCPSCLTVFNSEHKAYILKCGHSCCATFIDKCLEDVVEGNSHKMIECSLCKKNSIYGNGKKDIPRNYAAEEFGKIYP